MPHESPAVIIVLGEYAGGVVGTICVPPLDAAATKQLYRRRDTLPFAPFGVIKCMRVENHTSAPSGHHLFAVALPHASRDSEQGIVERLGTIFDHEPVGIAVEWVDDPYPFLLVMHAMRGM